MPRPTTKAALLQAAEENYQKLWQHIDSMPEQARQTAFDFSADDNKTAQHWHRDKNIRDILIHLYEWHQLLLNWINANMAGKPAHFFPAPYTWKTYGDLNIEFWHMHQSTAYDEAKKRLETSHQAVLAKIRTCSNEALFSKHYFDWTGTTTLGSYCISATSSHYDWAIKKLRAHVRRV